MSPPMAPVLLEVRMEGFHAAGASTWKKMLRRAYTIVGQRWIKAHLKEHFTMGATQKYGYPARSAKYLRRKQAKFHHQVPLVWKGTLRRQVLAPWNQRLHVTDKAVRITLTHDTRSHQTHVDLTTMGPDIDDLQEVLDRALEHELGLCRDRKTIRPHR